MTLHCCLKVTQFERVSILAPMKQTLSSYWVCTLHRTKTNLVKNYYWVAVAADVDPTSAGCCCCPRPCPPLCPPPCCCCWGFMPLWWPLLWPGPCVNVDTCGMILVTLPTALVRPSRKTKRWPVFKYSGCLTNLLRQRNIQIKYSESRI